MPETLPTDEKKMNAEIKLNKMSAIEMNIALHIKSSSKLLYEAIL